MAKANLMFVLLAEGEEEDLELFAASMKPAIDLVAETVVKAHFAGRVTILEREDEDGVQEPPRRSS